MTSSVRRNFRKLEVSKSRDKSSDDIDSFYPLKMTKDHRTEMYVKFAKVMLIFQGSVTEERNQAVRTLEEKFKYAGRLISEGTYKRENVTASISGGNLEDTILYFKSRVKKACEEGFNLIIIDHSIPNLVLLNLYAFLAQKFQYVILPYPPLSNHKTLDVVKTQAVKFKEFAKVSIDRPNYFKHLFSGWFLHDVDSAEMREEASLYVQDCLDKILDFRDYFEKVCKKNFREKYNLIDRRQDLAFCVTKIFENSLDSRVYMQSTHFKKHYGSMSKLYVVGFIVSPDVIAARIKLTHDQKFLWEMPDELDGKKMPDVFPSNLLKETKTKLPDLKVTLIASKSNRTIVTGNPIHEPTEVFPLRAKAKSCHIVLGKVDGASALNVDYAVPLAVFRERNAVQRFPEDVRPYELDRCLVRRLGKYWFIYLKETLVVNGLFGSCCDLEGN